jgi:hypothetical protein
MAMGNGITGTTGASHRQFDDCHNDDVGLSYHAASKIPSSFGAREYTPSTIAHHLCLCQEAQMVH